MPTAPHRASVVRLPVLLCSAALALLAGCKDRNHYEPPPPPKVAVAVPQAKSITRYLETTGSVQAINSVDLMARVQGFLQEIDYKDGGFVHKGDTLFVIEPLPYQARLQQAQAAEQGAQAQLTQASAEYDRQAQLGQKNFSSQSTVDVARATRDSAQSTLDQARANTQIAAINYTYTRIMAPFDGVVTAHQAAVGELVGTQPEKLASIVQLEPIWVGFNISEQDVLRVREALAKRGQSVAQLGRIPVQIGLQSESGYPHEGTLDYINPGIDPATGTLAVRAQFANTDRALIPGFFVRVRVPTETGVPALLVPDTALGSDQTGRTLLVANAGNVVELRHVVAGPLEGQLRVIESGLKPDDRVIVGGQQRAIPGDKVDPTLRPIAAP